MGHRFKCFPHSFFNAPAEVVAPALLGHRLLSCTSGKLCGGRIIEVEAYHEADPASHSHRGPTARNRAMFGPPGHAYVYLIYGVHHCVNVVCRPSGIGEAVLIRAITPEFDIKLMKQRRGVSSVSKLTDGPGKICRALAIGRAHDSIDLCDPNAALFIARAADAAEFVAESGAISISPRIGITKAAEAPLRFHLRKPR